MKETITIEELKSIIYGRMDWFRVFRDAYEGRRSSWHNIGNISEWRNATDEVLFAVWKQLEEEINALSTKEIKPIILDGNTISLAKYAEEYPENWEKIRNTLCWDCKHFKKEHPVRNLAGWIICRDFIDTDSFNSTKSVKDIIDNIREDPEAMKQVKKLRPDTHSQILKEIDKDYTNVLIDKYAKDKQEVKK